MPDRDYMYRGERHVSPFTRAVKWLLIVNAVVFLVQAFAGKSSVDNPMADWFGLWPGKIARGYLWQLVTHLFLHGGVLHLLFNLIVLYFFGVHIESKLGTRRFTAFYLTGGVFAGLAFCAVRWLRETEGYAIGASGAIMAVMVMFAVLWPHRQIWLFGVFPMPAWALVGFLVVLDLAGALRDRPGIAFEAHLGGAAYGYLFLRFAPAVEGWLSEVRRPRARHEASDFQREQDELDRILGKVHDEGIQSLKRGEQRFLKRYSDKHGRR